mmetsp:Transcript_8877/g.18445  ORF Transcript_8877/g.18445 Transcript_8877/m.18445 type:complete len:395 (-) Transcript_8877:72-1256(-)|eukprot:CAMPEP_0197277554 /NCGR_PEP_ID=MMETSP1432-20130617/17235_1 /TAXON_ID=44447 /ORGANISM="Pseudo-nitzschia delicatissima, Strain UNC1205" /LENGTH=394 /DNA_ID=CAMNT_0042743767 /DNA_START=47 /DNA_END=1231 /DNA_ORIENTATION=+
MAIARKNLSARVPLLRVFIILAVLFGFRDSATTVVNAFTSIVTGTKLASLKRTKQVETSRTGLSASDGHFEIRDFRLTDDESQQVYNFLSQREQKEREVSKIFFDPEGSLELDVSNKWTLTESYSRDDGGCFVVAVDGDCSESDDNENGRIVGTLGMISGTQVSYQPSGSSFSEPEITAALRRVCATRMVDDDDDDSNKILKALIRQGEQRAIASGATNLIGLAYPEVETSYSSNTNGENVNIVKPTVNLLESLGYRVSTQQIPGVTTIQYEKSLSKTDNEKLESNERNSQEGEWIIPATIASIFSLGWLVFNLYSNVFGIEQLWGSSDNGGVGTSMSSQYLEQLIRDEKLGRSGLDNDTGSASIRQWEDLSPEELREEQALMKIIQGQTIRSK